MMEHTHNQVMDGLIGGEAGTAPCKHQMMAAESGIQPEMMTGHGAHGGGGGGHGTFHHSTSAVLLFDKLQVGPDLVSYVLALLFIVALGVTRQELLRVSELDQHSAEKRAVLYFCQATISYLLMLVAMTFNIGLFFAVILGLTIGYYRSLVQQAKVSGKSECCA